MAKRKPPPPGFVPEPPPPPPPAPVDPADVPLTDDETRFVEEYLVDRNATRAYLTTFPGANYDTARRNGRRMRRRANVAREIRAAILMQSIRTRVNADLALKETARIAFSDVNDLYDPATNNLRHPRHIPLDARRAISSIKVSRVRTTEFRRGRTQVRVQEQEIEYKFWDKMNALEKLYAHLSLKQGLPPIEVFLSTLPGDLARVVRDALAEQTAPSRNGVHKG